MMKILPLALCLSLCLSLAACQQAPAASSTPEANSSALEAASSTPETASSAPEAANSAPEAASSAPEAASSAPEAASSAPEAASSAPETTGQQSPAPSQPAGGSPSGGKASTAQSKPTSAGQSQAKKSQQVLDDFPGSEATQSRSQTTPAAPQKPVKDLHAYTQEVVRQVNQQRAAEGLEPLQEVAVISQAAQMRAAELPELFSHTRPDGTSCSTAFDGLDGYTYWGENIAMGYEDPDAVMEGWMNSPGHRANILRESTQVIGVGCHEENGRLYWVQLFGLDDLWGALHPEESEPEQPEPEEPEPEQPEPEQPEPEQPEPEEPEPEEPEPEQPEPEQPEPEEPRLDDLENYTLTQPMTAQEAQEAGHCLVFLDSGDGEAYRYSCHMDSTTYGLEQVDGSIPKYIYTCEACTRALGHPVRYCYTGGQVYVWDR